MAILDLQKNPEPLSDQFMYFFLHFLLFIFIYGICKSDMRIPCFQETIEKLSE